MYIGSPDECRSPLSTTSGLSVYVTNHTYALTEEDDAISVMPGAEANVAIDRTFLKKLPYPYSQCLKWPCDQECQARSKYVRQTIELSKAYTQQYCMQLCFRTFLIHLCNCTEKLPNFNQSNVEICPKFIDSIYNCEYFVRRLFYDSKDEKLCQDQCPKECDYISYTTTVSNALFPSDGYNQLLKSRYMLPIDYRESSVALNVFYKSSQLISISEKPANTVDKYFAELGGALGSIEHVFDKYKLNF